MTTGREPGGHDPTGRAGHEHDRDYVDKDVDGPEPVEREGDYTDSDVVSDAPTVEREGEYTDSDVGPDDTDPPVGSYTDRDVPGGDRPTRSDS
jgi:hypothetical protein